MRSLKTFFSDKVLATDGVIGEVSDFYFDDFNWVVRYLIVNTGERQVLISPKAMRPEYDIQSMELPVDLTVKQIKSSPDIRFDRPVSRQNEIDLHEYYGWPYYWLPGTEIGGPMTAMPLPLPLETQPEPPKADDDPHLRSAQAVFGYNIEAEDGDAGKLDDFVVEESTWHIQYAVVDVSGKRVLVAPGCLKIIDSDAMRVVTELNVETLQASPEFDPSLPLDNQA